MHVLPQAEDRDHLQRDIAVIRPRRLLQDDLREDAVFDTVTPNPVEEIGARGLGRNEERALQAHRHQQQPLRVHVVEGLGRDDMLDDAVGAHRRDPAERQPVAMAEHAALGKAGRARGVLDVDEVIEFRLPRRDEIRRRGRGQLFPVARTTDDDRPGESREIPDLRRLTDLGQHAGLDHDRLRTAIGQHIGDLTRGIADIDRHHDRADPRQRQPGQRKGRNVRQHHADAVAEANAARRQPRRERTRLLSKLAITQDDARLEEIRRRGIAHFGGTSLDEGREIARERLGLDQRAQLRGFLQFPIHRPVPS